MKTMLHRPGTARLITATLLAAFLAAGCGGGGGGSDDKVEVSFDREELAATAFQNQQVDVNAFEAASASVVVTVENLPSSDLFVRVVDSGEGFTNATVEVTPMGNDQYTATLSPNVSLSPGTYEGSLTLELCKDASCDDTFETEGATIPYTVTITPQLSVTVKVNGVAVATLDSTATDDAPLSIAPGSTVEFESNVPISVAYTMSTRDVTVTVDDEATPTSWTAVLTPPQFGTSNFIELNARPDDSSKFKQRSVSVEVTLEP